MTMLSGQAAGLTQELATPTHIGHQEAGWTSILLFFFHSVRPV